MNRITVLRCSKCNTPANHKDNPKTTYEIRQKNNSYDGWLCKCGHYNAVDK